MADPDDELDPSDWLTAQFGEDEKPAPTPPPVVPGGVAEPPTWPETTPEPPTWPATTPEPPLWPTAGAPVQPQPAQPQPAQPQPAAPQLAPPVSPTQPVAPVQPVTPAQPPFTPPVTPPPAAEAPAAPAAAPPSGGGFSWGLTPGEDPAVVAATPPPLIPPPLTPPVVAPALIPPAAPAPPVAATPPAQPVVEAAASTVPAAPPAEALTQPMPAASTDYDQPTQAMPVVGSELEARDRDSWFAAPVDSSLDGVTEVIEAEIIGLAAPEGEGLDQPSGIDALFGETAFQEYDDQIVSAPPPRAPGGTAAPVAPKPPAAPIPRVQKILMIVAGSLVGVLAIVALFVIGMRLSDRILPVAAPTPTPTPTPTEQPIALGPVEPGTYQWNELVGGECLATWEGAWTQTFEVVDCGGDHPAQLVGRGLFEETEFDPYPGFDVLQGRMNALCTAPTIIDYTLARQFNDLQIAATVPVDEADWDTGNRSFFCFVTRSSGADLTGTIAKPAVLPTPTATPTPTGVPSTATPGGRGQASAPPKG